MAAACPSWALVCWHFPYTSTSPNLERRPSNCDPNADALFPKKNLRPAQAQRMETVLRWQDDFGQRSLKIIAAAARFFPRTSGINWFYRVLG
jgi:hypothetical protein